MGAGKVVSRVSTYYEGIHANFIRFEYLDKGIAFVKVENVKNGLIAHQTIKHRISEEANPESEALDP